MTDYLFIRFFDEAGSATIDQLGGKCASLVNLTAAGLPVPPGFAVTTVAYTSFVELTGLADEIDRLLEGLDPEDVAVVDEVSAKIRAEFLSREVPDAIAAEFARAYHGATVLVTGVGDPASRWHGIDESLHLGMWERACLAEALLLSRLAG